MWSLSPVATLTHGLGKRVLDVPSQDLDALPNSVSGDARDLSPFADGVRCSFMRDEVVVPLVSPLFLAGGPSAIAGFVVPVHVDSLDGCSFGTIPHVGDEVLELLPPFADGDSAPTVVLAGLVCAPPSHCLPDVVNAIAGSPVCLVSPREFTPPASTALSVPTGQGSRRHDGLGAAVAGAAPCHGRHAAKGHIRASLDHGQAPESLSGQVDEVGHGGYSITKTLGITYTVA